MSDEKICPVYTYQPIKRCDLCKEDNFEMSRVFVKGKQVCASCAIRDVDILRELIRRVKK